jgi:hypothetical protein
MSAMTDDSITADAKMFFVGFLSGAMRPGAKSGAGTTSV